MNHPTTKIKHLIIMIDNIHKLLGKSTDQQVRTNNPKETQSSR